MQIKLSKSEGKSIIWKESKKIWEDRWVNEIKGRHLFRIQKTVDVERIRGLNRREEIIINRIRTGHISNKVLVSCQPNGPDVFSGESITLTCEVQGGETTEWTCEWRKSGSIIHRIYSKDWTFIVSESSSGNYMCQCRSRDDWYSSTQWSEVFVTRQPNWPQMFSGESITLTCEVQGGETTEWTCEWKRSGSIIHRIYSKDWTFIVSESSRGDYTCQCRRRDDWYSSTQWSETIRLSVSGKLCKPKVQLSVNSLEIPGRVTLTCSVTPSSIGWKYYWFRDEKSAEPLMTQEPVFSPNELKSVSEKSLYWCRGGRGEPVYYTDYSNPITVSNNGDCKFNHFIDTVELHIFLEHCLPLEITVTQGGIYRCYGVRGNPEFYTEPSDDVTIRISCKFHYLIISLSFSIAQ
uniref:Ig-like domain-containing protein n=1 Tax=Xiphophorus maculatus TaxID=8083 RepID=A0A3B5Q7N6_XIPMA